MQVKMSSVLFILKIANIFYFLSCFVQCEECNQYIFGEKFKFGVSTSAYQVEGGWNKDGKGHNQWDELTTKYPDLILDHTNGREACNSYELYERDAELIQELKGDFYKFSISWSRIFPFGYNNIKNEAGIAYYNKILDELEKRNIEPYVTMFQWDLPQTLRAIGGATNEKFIAIFKDYAQTLFENFGKRVKYWITFNDPSGYCHLFSEMGNSTLIINIVGITEYLCSHNIILAHKEVYRMYEKNYKTDQKGQVSIGLSSNWFEPDTDSKEDKSAQDRIFDFILGIYAHTIWSEEGGYPPIVKQRVDDISRLHKFNRSRLPEFTEDEIKDVKGTADFFAINYFGSFMVKHIPDTEEVEEWPSVYEDMNVGLDDNPEWAKTGDSLINVYPEGLRKLLKYIKDKYNLTDVKVLENGYPSNNPEQNDTRRVEYIRNHIVQVGEAIRQDEVNVTAYCVWSLMDNFAWTRGYTVFYGLYGVDFDSPNKTRYPRASAMAYRQIITSRVVNYDFVPAIIEPTPTVCISLIVNSAATQVFHNILFQLIIITTMLLVKTLF